MNKFEKIRLRVLQEGTKANIRFEDLCCLLRSLGFGEHRGKGSHRLFKRAGILEMPVPQLEKGKEKPYQVRQVRALLIKHKLGEQE